MQVEVVALQTEPLVQEVLEVGVMVLLVGMLLLVQ
jgi:hypothetical protein